MITLRGINKTYYTEATSLHVLKNLDLHLNIPIFDKTGNTQSDSYSKANYSEANYSEA